MQVGYGAASLLLMLALCAPARSAQEDTPYIENPAQDAGDRLEDQPAVEELPDWLIGIPPEQQGEAQTRLTQVQQFVVADEHVVSQSRMFSVSGGDALRMGAIASHADTLRSHFNTLLNAGDEWKYAISIRLWGNTADPARANPIRTRVSILGSEPNLQIRIYSGGGIDLSRLDAAIVSMLLYEYALRDIQPAALPDYLEMPPWLITGIQQALLWKQGKIDRRLYQNLFNKADMMSPEDIINTEDPQKLDAGSRQVYEVSCGVLIMGLLNRDNGPERVRSLLSESLTQEGNSREMIAAHFHEMDLNNNTFSKWWALELAALAMPRSAEALTPLETEKQLEETLMLTGADKETRMPYSVKLTDLDEALKLPDWKEQLRACLDRLVELNLRSFPGYHSIIMEYCRAITELVRGAQAKDVQAILTPLQELREAYVQASIRGRDYLDWFEITQLGQYRGGNFDSYAEVMRLLRQETPGPTTPISRYLDDIEALHEQKEGEPLPDSLLRLIKETNKKTP